MNYPVNPYVNLKNQRNLSNSDYAAPNQSLNNSGVSVNRVAVNPYGTS
jgi:hypothetical protein